MTSNGFTAIALPTLQSVEEMHEASLLSFNEVIFEKKFGFFKNGKCALNFKFILPKDFIQNIIKTMWSVGDGYIIS